MIGEPDAVRQQRMRRIQQAKFFQRFHGTFVIAPLGFLHVEFALVAVGMKANLIMPGNVHCTFIGIRRGIEHVLKPHPHMNSALRAAVPLLDQGFVGIERFEIIVVRMLGDIRDKDRADPESRGGLGTAMHVTPHIHDGGRPRQEALLHSRARRRSPLPVHSPRGASGQ